jgi:hypothetical protein
VGCDEPFFLARKGADGKACRYLTTLSAGRRLVTNQMEWLKQAYPNCSASTLDKAVREAHWDYVEAHKKLKSKGSSFSDGSF